MTWSSERAPGVVLAVAGAVALLTGCGSDDGRAAVTHQCEGRDMVYVIDPAGEEIAMFVVPNHAGCKESG